MAKPRIRGATLNFGEAVNAFVNNTVEKMDTVHRNVVTGLADRIIMGTPYGDPRLWKHAPPKDYVPGLARGNWQTRNGDLPPTTVLPIRPAHLAYAEAAANAGQAGTVTYMLNSVPYIFRLEYEGHSTQAPAGMVRINVAGFVQFVEQVAQEVAR